MADTIIVQPIVPTITVSGVGPQGLKGDTGSQGATGATGATGAKGDTGAGVPTGGTTGQILSKIDGTNYNTQWIATPATGVTSITAGSGLTGGTITSSGTIAVDTSTIVATAQKGAANGVATLDGSGLIPQNQLPAVAITDTFVVASQAAMLALTAQTGDVAVRTDVSKSFILTASPATTLANWQELLSPAQGVTSITATAPLTGGTITSSGSIGLDQTALAITPSQVTGTAVITTDSRLSNARTPTAHASTHASAGSDPVSISSSQVSDIATLYVPQTGSTTVTGTTTLTPSAAANRALIVKGAASQSADLQQWQNSAGTILSRVKADGTPTFSYGTFFGTQALSADGDAVRPLTLKGFSSAQSGNLVEYLTSGSTILGGTNAVGQTYTGSTTPILTAVGGATTATTGTGTTATVTTTSAPNLAVGDLITVAGITPTGYNTTGAVVTAVSNTSPFSVSYANATTGAQTVAGTVSTPAQASITARSAGTIGLVIKGATSQVTDLLRLQDSTSATLFAISSAGQLKMTGTIAAYDGLTSMNFGAGRNVGFASANSSFGGGSGVIGIQNATTVPTSNPTGGGVLYASAGALNYIGTSGTAAAIVNADGTRTLDGGTA